MSPIRDPRSEIERFTYGRYLKAMRSHEGNWLFRQRISGLALVGWWRRAKEAAHV